MLQKNGDPVRGCRFSYLRWMRRRLLATCQWCVATGGLFRRKANPPSSTKSSQAVCSLRQCAACDNFSLFKNRQCVHAAVSLFWIVPAAQSPVPASTLCAAFRMKRERFAHICRGNICGWTGTNIVCPPFRRMVIPRGAVRGTLSARSVSRLLRWDTSTPKPTAFREGWRIFWGNCVLIGGREGKVNADIELMFYVCV